jgi:hypothetical protein
MVNIVRDKATIEAQRIRRAKIIEMEKNRLAEKPLWIVLLDSISSIFKEKPNVKNANH